MKNLIRKILKEEINSEWGWIGQDLSKGEEDYNTINKLRDNKPSKMEWGGNGETVIRQEDGTIMEFPKSELTTMDFGRNLGKYSFIELFNPNMKYMFHGYSYPQRLVGGMDTDKYVYSNDDEGMPPLNTFTFEELVTAYINGKTGVQTLGSTNNIADYDH